MEQTNTKAWFCRSPHFILPLIALILVFIIVIISILREAIVRENNWQISVIGQGRVTYQPDIANINLEVEVNKAQKAEDALSNLNSTINNVVKAIKNAGVSDQDIQTQNYSLYPFYENINNVNKLTGYNANQSINVKVRDINKNVDLAGQVISAAGKAGANKINGITFEASNINDIRQEARLKAITDARSKSQSLSTALGIKLKKVVGWWENYIGPESISYAADGKGGMGGGGGGNGPMVTSGDREMVIEVNVSYLIK